MFEKIIKKIEKRKCNPCDSDYTTGNNYGLNEAIDILQEEEAKPFDPESFGFISQGGNGDSFGIEYILNDIRLYKSNNLFIVHKGYAVFFKCRINSQFEGKIILKSLGIVE